MIGVPGAYGEQANEAQMPVAHPHDLPNRPDLQWLVTTSNVDIRTLTPPSTVSSPHVGLPPLYHNQPSPPGPLGHHMMDEGVTSAVTITHHQMHPRFPQGVQEPPALQRMPSKRTATTATGQPKPKGTPGRKRKVPDHELSPAEATKRHIRRERNKVAAAKCRNRRRELTDRLQGETDQLEESQNMLHQEIMSLQQEKEHLEFILATHSPNCKAGLPSGADAAGLMQREEHGMMRDSSSATAIPELSLVPPPEVMEDQQHHGAYYPVHDPHQQDGRQQVSVITAAPPNTRHNEPRYDVSAPNQPSGGNPIPTDLSQHGQQSYSAAARRNQFANMSLDSLESTLSTEGSLNTPVCTLATPSVSTGVFTFPSTPGMNTSTATTDTNFHFSSSSQEYAPRQPTTPSYSGSVAFSALHGQQPYTCAAAHRRSSSSESHHSPDSVQSPKLLAL